MVRLAHLSPISASRRKRYYSETSATPKQQSQPIFICVLQMQKVSVEPSSFTCDSWDRKGDGKALKLRRDCFTVPQFPLPRKQVPWPSRPSSMPKRFPIEPHENDVLLGRGGRNNQHTGNERLRDLARQFCDQYKISSKREKSELSRLLVRTMRQLDPPSRFLKRNQQSSEWIEVGDDAAREKTSQVLRDAVTGLLDKKGPTSCSPSATISAPASRDEQDVGLALVGSASETSADYSSPVSDYKASSLEEVTSGVARLPSDDTSQSDAAPRAYDLSPRKRKRHGAANPISATHSFDDRSSSTASSLAFDCSPIRRHAHQHSPKSRHRSRCHTVVSNTTADHPTEQSRHPVPSSTTGPPMTTRGGHNRSMGTDYLGQLMQGDLLESDSDEHDLPLMPRGM